MLAENRATYIPAWQRDKNQADKFLPQLKRIAGDYLIGSAPQEEDAERNTDLIVLGLNAVRIACRVRKYQYHARYGGEFTIRESRPSGTKTELEKIIEGWGDYIIYAIADEDYEDFICWVLGDLKVFRSWFHAETKRNHGIEPGFHKPNNDGSSFFRAFEIDSLPPRFTVARLKYTPPEAD